MRKSLCTHGVILRICYTYASILNNKNRGTCKSFREIMMIQDSKDIVQMRQQKFKTITRLYKLHGSNAVGPTTNQSAPCKSWIFCKKGLRRPWVAESRGLKCTRQRRLCIDGTSYRCCLSSWGRFKAGRE